MNIIIPEEKSLYISSVKTEGDGYIATHYPDCPISLGTMDPSQDLECGCNGGVETFVNQTLTAGLLSLAKRIADPEGSGLGKGFINYLEIGMSPTAPVQADPGTLKPKARSLIKRGYDDTTNAVFKFYIGPLIGNSNSGIVATGTSTTVFTLQSGQGTNFAIGQAIRINGGAFTNEDTVITNVATDTITVSPALTSTPVGSEVIKQRIAEKVLYGDSPATGTIGTGTPYARTVSFTSYTKDQGFAKSGEWRYTFI